MENKKSWFQKIFFYDIGMFIGGALIALAIFSGILIILNYFNILSLSSIYKPLSVLPKIENGKNQELTDQEKKDLIAKQGLTSTTSNFTYDAEKAKSLLIEYMTNTFKREYLPNPLSIERGLTSTGRIQNKPFLFGSYYSLDKTTLSTAFEYKEDTNIANIYGITIRVQDLKQTAATVPLANTLLKKYFSNPYLVTNCKTGGATTYCENFQITTNGKEGYGIASRNSFLIIFNCFIPKDSTYYSNNSCIYSY